MHELISIYTVNTVISFYLFLQGLLLSLSSLFFLPSIEALIHDSQIHDWLPFISISNLTSDPR